MNSEDVSLIALEPFINKFVFAIIQSIRSQNFSYEEKHVIHADLVPKVSEKVIHSSLREKEVLSTKKDMDELVAPMNESIIEISVKAPVGIPVEVPVKKQTPHISPQTYSREAPWLSPEIPVFSPSVFPRKISESFLKKKEALFARETLKEPTILASRNIGEIPVKKQMSHIRLAHPSKVIVPPIPFHPQLASGSSHLVFPQKASAHLSRMSPQKVLVPQVSTHKIQPEAHKAVVSASAELGQDYGRIALLLDDSMISLIECQGAGKPVMVIRAGQRQITRIVLSPMEIKGILQKASDDAHIPLLEGVFRAAIDNFSINAIMSEIVGSKFVIRKQTPYSLLERQV